MTVGQSGPLPPAAVLQVAVLWIYMQCDTPMPPYIKAIKACSMTSHQPGATNYALQHANACRIVHPTQGLTFYSPKPLNTQPHL